MDIQELLREFLKEAGYEVMAASDGIEAMDLFCARLLRRRTAAILRIKMGTEKGFVM